MLSTIAKKIFKMKYAQGEESWADTCLRVAGYLGHDAEEIANYFQLMHELVFLPGGRIIANAGTGIKNLMNCFVLPIEDSRQSIYETLKNAAEIFAWGGGIGYNFSNLREEGAPVKTTGGEASGPLSFMSLFDQTGEVISQASRRGAQMGILDVGHPDIIKFIQFKSELNKRNKRLLEEYRRNLPMYEVEHLKMLEKTLADDQLTHFNISVAVNNKFMNYAMEDKKWNTRGISDKKLKKTGYTAREVLELIAEKAWKSGDPGIFFYDRTNEDNMVPYLGDLRATNPCGEVPLLDYEPCCLGSINLNSFYEGDDTINLEFLEFTVRNAVRFLNRVQDVSETPVSEINEWSKGLRRIGLGVMGWADLLANLEVPYDSEKAIKLAEYLSWFISYFAWLESIELAEKDGPFPFYDGKRVKFDVVENILNSDIHPGKHNIEAVKKSGVRNVSVTSIAPTGTIAIISGVNSSIEPFYALSYRRNITEGVGNIAKDSFIEINPILFRKLKERGLNEDQIEEVKLFINSKGSVKNCELVPEDLQEVFKTAHEIHWMDHVNMQSAWQSFVTNAVSKTINMPNDSTVEDIYQAFIYMWGMGLKGGTIYRDGSKSFQILSTGS